MAKKNTKKSAAVEMTASAILVQPVTFEGTFVSDEGASFVVMTKKPRSSKMIRRVIPKAKIAIMGIFGEAVEGTAVEVTLRPEASEYTSFTGNVEVADGFVAVTNEDGETVLFAEDLATVEAEEDGESGGKKKKPAKKEKAKAEPKKGKGKKKEEEEDDDDEEEGDDDEEEGDDDEDEGDDDEDGDEDWDDDEEEEKPKKGKGKAKAAPAKGKGKAKKGKK